MMYGHTKLLWGNPLVAYVTLWLVLRSVRKASHPRKLLEIADF